MTTVNVNPPLPPLTLKQSFIVWKTTGQLVEPFTTLYGLAQRALLIVLIFLFTICLFPVGPDERTKQRRAAERAFEEARPRCRLKSIAVLCVDLDESPLGRVRDRLCHQAKRIEGRLNITLEIEAESYFWRPQWFTAQYEEEDDRLLEMYEIEKRLLKL